MSKIPTKIPITLVSMLFFVLILEFASPANAYSDKEIVDYINNNLAGASDAEIAAVASSFGVSASDISNAYQEVSGVDVSARAEEAFEQVVTVTVNDTNYYTTVGESANVYTAPPVEGGVNNSVGTFDASTGLFTDTNNATRDITTLSNVTGSISNAGGTVTTQISGQAWDTVVGATTAGSTYLSCTTSGATGCLGSYLSSGGANVSITSLTASQRRSCIPGTIYTVFCRDHAGTLGIPTNFSIGNATYSVDSCGILTTDISGCSALPTPSTPTVSVTPNPVVSNQDISVSWTTSTGATRYEYKTDVSATPTSMDGFTNPWRGTSAGFVEGDHTIFVRGCSSPTNCGEWGSGNFRVISAYAPNIISFTANPKGFSSSGGNVTLSWVTINADSCTLTGGGLNLTGDPRTVTSYTIPSRVTSTATYTLTCSGPGGTTTQ